MDSLILTLPVYNNFVDIGILHRLSLTSKSTNILVKRYLEKYKNNYIFLKKLGNIPIKQDTSSKWCMPENIIEYDLEYFVSTFGNKLNKFETTLYYYYFIRNLRSYQKRFEYGKDYKMFLIYKEHNYVRQLESTDGTIFINQYNNDDSLMNLSFEILYSYVNCVKVCKSINLSYSSPNRFGTIEHNANIDLDLLLHLLNYKGNWSRLLYFL